MKKNKILEYAKELAIEMEAKSLKIISNYSPNVDVEIIQEKPRNKYFDKPKHNYKKN